MKIVFAGIANSFAHFPAKKLAKKLGCKEDPAGSPAGMFDYMLGKKGLLGVVPYRGKSSGLFEDTSHAAAGMYDFDVYDVIDETSNVYLYRREGDDSEIKKVVCGKDQAKIIKKAVKRSWPDSGVKVEEYHDASAAARKISFSSEKGVAVACHLYAGIVHNLTREESSGGPFASERIRYLVVKNVRPRKNENHLDNYLKVESPVEWDEYFMLQAMIAAFRSKDPSTKVGCVLVNQRKKQIGFGYNGFPRGLDDNALPWGKDGDKLEHTKHGYVVHAELNAILNAESSLRGSSCYVTLFPCHECAKSIVASGVSEVFYLKKKDNEPEQVSRKMFAMAGIKIKQVEIGGKSLKKLEEHMTRMLSD